MILTAWQGVKSYTTSTRTENKWRIKIGREINISYVSSSFHYFYIGNGANRFPTTNLMQY